MKKRTKKILQKDAHEILVGVVIGLIVQFVGKLIFG